MNPWMHLVELVVPGIIGAGLALFGVWLTNKNNQKTNAANRQHQLDVEVAKAEIAAKYKIQDNRWAFRKDVYVGLITAVEAIISLNGRSLEHLIRTDALPEYFLNETFECAKGFLIAANLAPLAASDDVLPLVKSMQDSFGKDDCAVDKERLKRVLRLFQELKQALHAAGRKDLWGTPEGEAQAEAAKR